MKQILPFLFFLVTLYMANAQCTSPEMTIWQNTWQSCQTLENPNTNRSAGHWIQYDLGSERVISKVHVWNTNDPTQLENGFRSVTVDYSNDGVNWTPMISHRERENLFMAVLRALTFKDKKRDMSY
nr:discoidin domain-containing protein [uncultured Allomuricauda sp.]